MNSKKEFNNEAKRQQSRETTKGEGVTLQKTENNLTFNEVVNYECGISGLSCKAGEVGEFVMAYSVGCSVFCISLSNETVR